MSLKILGLLLLVAVALAAPVEDEVLLGIPGYTGHKWYSGKIFSDARLSQLYPRSFPLYLL